MKIRIPVRVMILLIISLALLSSCEEFQDKNPKAVKGVIDLSDYDFDGRGPAELSGEWEFYWNQYILPNDFKKNGVLKTEAKTYISIPGGWNRNIADGKEFPGNGYGTLRLTVLTRPEQKRLSLDISYVTSAYLLYINGRQVGSAGSVFSSENPEKAEHRPHNIISFKPEGLKIEIVILISNYHIMYGGIWDPVLLGNPSDIQAVRSGTLITASLVSGGFLVIFFYNLILFLIQRSDKTYLYSALLSLAGAIWIFITLEYCIVLLMPFLNWEMVSKIEYINMIVAMVLFGMFFKSRYPDEIRPSPLLVMQFLGAGLILLILFLSVEQYVHLVQIFGIISIVFLAYILNAVFRAARKREKDAVALFIVSGILIATLLNDIAKKNGIIFFNEYISPYGLFLFITTQAFIISCRFFISFRRESAAMSGIRKKTAELTETGNFLDTVFNSISSMLMAMDSEGRIVQSNSAAKESLGIGSENKVPPFVWDIPVVADENKNQVRESFMKHSSLTVASDDLKGNRNRLYNLNFCPMSHDMSEGSVLKIDDVTELSRSDEQIKYAEQMETIGTLAGGLAHDFNNLLTGIVGSAALVRESVVQGEFPRQKTLERLNLIEQAAGRAVKLVNQLKTIAKRQDFNCVGVDLNAMVVNSVNMCRSIFDRSITINVGRLDNETFIYADPSQMEQVILNLCVNAGHAMTMMRSPGEYPGGVLEIRISVIDADSELLTPYAMLAGSECVAIDISDTGVGMDRETIGRIFEPFFTTKENGTGLGLVMVSNIVQQHGGIVEVRSEKGKGTQFRIIMPRYYPTERLIDDSSGKPLPKGNGMVLLVEDNDVLRESTEDILRLWDYEVVSAADSYEALSIFRKRHPEFSGVILNMSMPRMHGKDLYAELRKLRKNVKIIISSGTRPDPEMLNRLRMDGNGFIEKPYSMDELLRVCGEVFSGTGGI